jgi:hypothetical protein
MTELTEMKTRKWFYPLAVVLTAGICMVSCEKNGNEDPDPVEGNFTSLESPYLICANRNPGGVGFDFEYHEEKGGANNMDSLTVTDFEEDIFIRTLKGEKPDGSLGGAPYIRLSEDAVEAVNYSGVDPACKGVAAFENLNSSNLQSCDLQFDAEGFDPSAVATGQTGKPMMSGLMAEYEKLVIGIRWKGPANNDVEGDEPVWLIRTREGRLVKFIVTDFPADPAPTATGYISIMWDFID